MKMSYMLWLRKLITPIDDPDKTQYYSTLLDILYHTEWPQANEDALPWALDDDNRRKDGLTLREDFCRENFVEYWDEPCSILEVLVALAVKIEFIMSNNEYGNRMPLWFWSMLETWLETIDLYSDLKWNKLTTNVLTMRMDILFNRNYEPDGRGGLFYSPYSPDMRELPIWYQMQEYIKLIEE